MFEQNQKEMIVINESESNFKKASEVTWTIAKRLFTGELQKHISTAQACMIDNNWASLATIELTVTLNEATNKFCCWEYGGATNSSGSALLIGLPSGDKPLALSAFRSHHSPNHTHAVVQVWNGCIVAIATQNKGNGVILLYKVETINPRETPYVHRDKETGEHSSKTVMRFAASLSLSKIINITTNETFIFNSDLQSISIGHPIVKTAIKKASFYNCQQALYIRPFFFISDGYKDWDLDKFEYDDFIDDPNKVSSKLIEIITTLSNAVKNTDKKELAILGITTNGAPSVEVGTPDGLYAKFVVITKNITECYWMYITEEIFNCFKDFFECGSYNDFRKIAFGDDVFKRTSICKYVGN